MKKSRISFLLLLLCVGIVFTACAPADPVRECSKALGVDLSGGVIQRAEDTHGGFHGDGSTFVSIVFDKEAGAAIAAQLESANHWSPLPLTKTLHALAYGESTAASQIGPFVVDASGDALFPAVKNGWYFFLDRQASDQKQQDKTSLLDRYSFNFTFAVYDQDSAVLYYYELDT